MGFPAIWMNGRITPPAEARVSVFDHGLLYGDGVFEGVRYYARTPFRGPAHLARLARSAAAIGLELPYGPEALGAAMSAVIDAAGAPDGYLRLLVTRGEGDLGLDPRSCRQPTTVIAAAPLRAFEDARAGVSVVVASTRQAPLDVVDPRIKSLNYLNRLLARLEAVRAQADEAIMLNQGGRIAEGTTDNVFIVQGGILATPPAADGALEGITRAVVMDLARDLGQPVREASLGAYDLLTADEAFLVGTGVELVPIRSVDGRALKACPGPVFARLLPAFRAFVDRETAGA